LRGCYVAAAAFALFQIKGFSSSRQRVEGRRCLFYLDRVKAERKRERDREKLQIREEGIRKNKKHLKYVQYSMIGIVSLEIRIDFKKNIQ
jgi:hypothetical protein